MKEIIKNPFDVDENIPREYRQPDHMLYQMRYDSGRCRNFYVDYDEYKFETLIQKVDKSMYKEGYFCFDEVNVGVRCEDGRWTIVGPGLPENGYTFKSPLAFETIAAIETYVTLGRTKGLKEAYEKANEKANKDVKDAEEVIERLSKYETGNAEAFLDAFNKDNDTAHTPYTLAKYLDRNLGLGYGFFETETDHAKRLLMDLFKEYRDVIIAKMFENKEIKVQLVYDQWMNGIYATINYNWNYIEGEYLHDDAITDVWANDFKLLILCDIADLLGIFDMYQELTDTNHPNYKKLDYMSEVA